MKKILLAASAIALLSSAAFAQDSNLRFGLGVSSMGATLEGAYRFNQNWAVRGVVAGGLGINGTQTIDGVNYDTNGQLGGFALLADYYTGNSGFRVSGGAFVSNTSFSGSATASPANPIEIGGTTLVGGESTSASIEFSRKVSPMLTVSYDWNIVVKLAQSEWAV
jgi:opacity protein-like surface antigen